MLKTSVDEFIHIPENHTYLQVTRHTKFSNQVLVHTLVWKITFKVGRLPQLIHI